MKAGEITVIRAPDAKCARCWRRHESVTQIDDYFDLCCTCAYDIDHGVCNNWQSAHKDNPEAKAHRDALKTGAAS